MYFPRDMKYVSILSNPRAETDAIRSTGEPLARTKLDGFVPQYQHASSIIIGQPE